jgi:hypothetical protein
MQYVEKLSDRQAAEAVRDKISWKYALSLELEDRGFNFSVLSEFRDRLVDNQAMHRLLDIMVKRLGHSPHQLTRYELDMIRHLHNGEVQPLHIRKTLPRLSVKLMICLFTRCKVCEIA